MATLFETLLDEYIAATNAYQPAGATARGFHEHDGRLGDRSQTAIEERMRHVRGFLDRLRRIDASALPGHAPHDADILARRLQWELTEHEHVRSWQRNPVGYAATIGSACNALIIRDFAPLPNRIRLLTSRLRAVPGLLEQAKANLRAPSRIHVETAMEAATGIGVLLQRDLPAAAARAGDAALLQAFDEANSAARAAVEAYAAWLKNDLLPRANEDFAWGADTFRALLSQTDGVDDPLETLIQRGEADLRAHQQALRDTAAKIDAHGAPEDVVDAVAKDHPTPERLLPDTEALLEELRQFSIDAGICTMPTDVRIAVTETPGFSRMTTQAACSTPGPFERIAKEAYYYVTPPDPAWPSERTESYLKFFNRWSIAGVSAHEAYPGHYVHLTYLSRAQSVAGRYLLTTTTVEGWAHYVEQVMVEAGYAGGDPRYQLMQIREALMRLCRYRAAFGLHVEGWSVQQAIDFFVREGFATPVIAERETRRGVMGPNYYAYTLGKHRILGLREQLRKRGGASFDQRAFHDTLMQLPYPVDTIAQIMTDEAAPARA